MICDKHSDEEVDSSSGKSYGTEYVRNISRYGTYFLRQRDGILKGCEEIRVGGQ